MKIQQNVLGIALLGTATIALFYQTIGYAFLFWDDPILIVRNEIALSGLSDFSNIFATNENVRFMPVVWIICKTLVSLFGMTPIAFHGANVLFHAINTCLLAAAILTFTAIAQSAQMKDSSLRLLFAISMAALWAWHPLRVEPIAWVTALTYHIATFFFLISLISLNFYLRANEKHEPSLRWEILHYLFFGLSAFAYPVSYTWPLSVPFLLLFLNSDTNSPWTHLKQNLRIPILCGLIALIPLLITLTARITDDSIYYDPVDIEASILERFRLVLEGIGFMVQRTALPLNLTPTAWPEAAAYFSPAVLFLGILTLFLIIVSVVLRHKIARRVRWLLLSLAMMTLPVLNLLELNPFLPDRYAHLAQCYLTLLLAIFITKTPSNPSLWFKYLTILALILCPAFALLSFNQTPKWSDSETLLDHNEEQAWANAPRPKYILTRLRAGNHEWKGRYLEAISTYKKLAQMSPKGSMSWHVIGQCHFQLGDYEAAEAALQKALNMRTTPAPKTKAFLNYIRKKREETGR